MQKQKVVTDFRIHVDSGGIATVLARLLHALGDLCGRAGSADTGIGVST